MSLSLVAFPALVCKKRLSNLTARIDLTTGEQVFDHEAVQRHGGHLHTLARAHQGTRFDDSFTPHHLTI